MKRKLSLDDLRVDTFETAPVQKQRGTVFGEQCTCQTVCSCPGCPTCHVTCDDPTCVDNTCWGDTCEGSCPIDGCALSRFCPPW